MTVYSENQAKQHLDSVLDDASAQGEVRIRRDDGQEFAVRPLSNAALDRAVICNHKQRDLSDLAGTWVEDPAFDQAIREHDQIDPELWK